MKNKINLLLEDMSFNTKYEVLEYAKDKSEMEEVAKKRGITLPAHDLAIFKGIYAYVDRQNKNGCTLLKEEAKKAVNTLNGKAVDFDHYRKQVVGYWLDAKVVGDKIIAYGVFFRGNFPEDYELVKKLMESGSLGISFEAYGVREFTSLDTYNFNDLEFSGGGLLIKTKPAFDGAGVLELANKNKVLEFAKVMVAPNTFLHSKIEEANLIVEDLPTIYELIRDLECPTCKEKALTNLLMVDFEKKELRVKCYVCGAEAKIDLKPSIELKKKGKKIDKDLKMAFLLEKDKTKIEGDKKMEEKIKELEKELASLKDQLAKKDEELKAKADELTKASAEAETSKATIDELKKESDEAKVKIEEVEKTKADEIEKAKEDATKETKRKAELGDEFSKDVNLLDDKEYELAKAKKELATKEKEIVELKKGSKGKTTMDKGSTNDDDTDPILEQAERQRKITWED